MIKPALEKAPGCPMALSTMYKLLHRQGWRKRAPDKRHPKSDEQAQAGLEKNSEEIHKCRQAKARGMPITLMFQDKACFGRINNVRRGWAPKPIRPRC